jgi:hypothetical protein
VTIDGARAARYARQLVIPAIGEAGQERLAAACVRVIGASATAAPASLYLALAGVGTLWVDDPEPVSPADAGHWLYAPARVGDGRATVVAAELRDRSAFVRAEPWSPGVSVTAALVLAPSREQATAAAEEARLSAVPAVVAEVDGDGGTVVTIPVGAPCYVCARPIGGAGRLPTAGAAALAALAAEELVFLLADPSSAVGRRLELTRGVPSARATNRLAGCACALGIAR